MTTLLTGATGFVGSAVARALLAKGDNVRVTARPGADRTNLKGLNLQIVAADLNDTASLRDALDGCDTLYHVAADYRLWAPRPQEMLRTNVEGTRALMLAALDAGVQRIVYCSSVAVLGLHKDGSLADEETPSTLSDMIGVYKQSKFLAEVAVRELVKEKSLPAVIVNPAAPIGPRDIRPTPTGQMIFDAVRGKMPGFLNTGLNVVHVDDVAAGHLLAAEQGQIGRRYILGGDNMTMEEILGVVARELGQKPPKWKVPYALAYTAGCVSEAVSRVTGKPPGVPLDGVKMARKLMFFSCNRARQELGYSPRPAEAAIADAVRYFQKRLSEKSSTPDTRQSGPNVSTLASS